MPALNTSPDQRIRELERRWRSSGSPADERALVEGKLRFGLDRDRLAIAIGGVEVARAGERVAEYDEAPVAAHMQGREIDIAVDVGVGRGKATVWTCDLTHGYVDINADYRT